MKPQNTRPSIVAIATKSCGATLQTWRRYADGSVDSFMTSDGVFGFSTTSLPMPAINVPADVLLSLDVDEETRRTSAYQELERFLNEADKTRSRLSQALRETRAEIHARLARERGLS